MSEVAELLLARSRSSSAGLLETALLACVAAGFGILPAVAVLHPEIALSQGEIVLTWILLLTTILGAAVVAWRLFGSESIQVDGDTVLISQRLAFLSRSRRVPLAEVTEVSVPAFDRTQLQNNIFGVGHPAILIQHGTSVTRCGLALNPVEATHLAERLRDLAEERRRRTRG